MLRRSARYRVRIALYSAIMRPRADAADDRGGSRGCLGVRSRRVDSLPRKRVRQSRTASVCQNTATATRGLRRRTSLHATAHPGAEETTLA
jgi:hypothetical protein